MYALTVADNAIAVPQFIVQRAGIHPTQENTFQIHFTNGNILEVADDGQSCCEHRYLTCDDDLDGLPGQTIVSIEVSGVGLADDDGSGMDHEQAFVRIQFSRFAVTLCTHNEHNGYYGGFSLHVRLLSQDGRQIAAKSLSTYV